MTPKKTFLTTVVFALLIAMGLAAGLMPGAGLLSVKQMFSAAEAYIVDLNRLELDTDNNPLTDVNEPIEMLGGSQILVNAVAVYNNGAREDLLIGPDLQYSVDPPELGTIEANTGELRARFTASTDLELEDEDVVEGTIIATAITTDEEGEELEEVVGTLDIEVTPLQVTSISVVTPQDGGILYVKEDVDTDVPIVAVTNAPQVTDSVDFLADGEDIGTDTTTPYTALYTADSSQEGDSIEFTAQTDGADGLLSDTSEVEVEIFPDDTDNNGVPDDYFGDMDEGDVTYAVAGSANVVVAGLPAEPDEDMTVATADGIIVELPDDIYDHIEGVDSGDIESVRLIVRTGSEVGDVLGSTPGGLPEESEQVGNAIDIHLLMVIDGEVVEVHNFTEPITIKIPLDGDIDVAQLFGISTELDVNADPAVVGDAFAQMGVSAEIVGGMLVFNVTEFTSYVPLSVDGAPVVTGIVPSQGSEAGGTTVTITGDDFAPNAEVTIGGETATVTEYNIDPSGPDSIVATTPRYDILRDTDVD
ncbi:MAG: IPT/TIG domain-containing protein, partial [Candidatus Hydrogenedentes bacterium]|nr:IPT/TIG domain-containing protein [Candidatus Hydrogenedentota bacterium]